MSRYGRSEKEKKELIEQQNKEEMEWRKGHIMCKNGHAGDTMWVKPGEKCDWCGEKLLPFCNTIGLRNYTGAYADVYRKDKIR
jgi:hypothetical protein